MPLARQQARQWDQSFPLLELRSVVYWAPRFILGLWTKVERRDWAVAEDGTRVPISLIYRAGLEGRAGG